MLTYLAIGFVAALFARQLGMLLVAGIVIAVPCALVGAWGYFVFGG